MKKYIIVLLALILVLCVGCGKQDPVQTEVPTTAPVETTVPPTTVPPETTVPPTTEAPIPVPELSVRYAMVDKTPAILDTLLRDDVVDVVGEYDEDHYVIKTDLGYGLVKKEMLRIEGEPAYEVWTGYASYNAAVYENFYFLGEPTKRLNQNAQVQILDDLGYCFIVQAEDMMGFMLKNSVSRYPIVSDPAGEDGGDISLQAPGGISWLSVVEQTGDVTGQAVVLADGAEVILGYFDRGEEISEVVEEGFAENWDGYVTVYLDGFYTYVPQMLVLPEGAEPYVAWDGYSVWNGAIYDNFYLLGDPISKLNTNTTVHVVEELETCYLVKVNDVYGYMSKDSVSKTKIPTGGGEEWSPPKL